MRAAFEFVRQHVDQHFGIRLGIDVAVIDIEQFTLERHRVDQVAVVRQHQAERRVDVKRLRFLLALGIARGGVAHLADAIVARQRPHIAGAEHIAHHAARLVHVELGPRSGDDARRILPTVLQQKQRIVEKLVHGLLRDDADDAAHGLDLSGDESKAVPFSAAADEAPKPLATRDGSSATKIARAV